MNDDRIEILKSQLPELFDIRQIQESALEDYWVFPFDLEDSETLEEESFTDPAEIMGPLVSHEEPMDRRYPGLAEAVEGIEQVFGGDFPGAPTAPAGQARMPSTETLAFYLPYHVFGPKHWGIYIILEGLGGGK